MNGLQPRANLLPVEVIGNSNLGNDHPMGMNVLADKQGVANTLTRVCREGERVKRLFLVAIDSAIIVIGMEIGKGGIDGEMAIVIVDVLGNHPSKAVGGMECQRSICLRLERPVLALVHVGKSSPMLMSIKECRLVVIVFFPHLPSIAGRPSGSALRVSGRKEDVPCV